MTLTYEFFFTLTRPFRKKHGSVGFTTLSKFRKNAETQVSK